MKEDLTILVLTMAMIAICAFTGRSRAFSMTLEAIDGVCRKGKTGSMAKSGGGAE